MTPSAISMGVVGRLDLVDVGLGALDLDGVDVLGVDGLARGAVPVGVGLLLGVEGELVDQALVIDGVLREVLAVVHRERRHAVGGEHVGVGRDQPRVVTVDAVRDVVLVDHQAGAVRPRDHLVVGGLGVGLGDAGGLDRVGLQLPCRDVELLGLTAEVRRRVDVDRGLLHRSRGPQQAHETCYQKEAPNPNNTGIILRIQSLPELVADGSAPATNPGRGILTECLGPCAQPVAGPFLPVDRPDVCTPGRPVVVWHSSRPRGPRMPGSRIAVPTTRRERWRDRCVRGAGMAPTRGASA